MSHPEPSRALDLDLLIDALRLVTRESPDSAFVITLDGLIVMANATLCTSLGVEESALLGRPFDLSARSSDPERIMQSFRAASLGNPARYRGAGTRTTGEYFAAEITLLPLRVDGEVVAVFGTAVDQTEVDRHTADARRSEELLRLAGDLVGFGGWRVDADTREVRLSDSARRMLGIPDDVADLTVATWQLHSDDGQRQISALIERCLATAEPFDLESQMRTTRGEILTVRTVGEADVNVDGSIVGVHGALWNITDTVAARDRERALESRLTATLNAISDGIFFLDSDSRVTFANARTLDMVGLTEAQVVGHQPWSLFAEVDVAGFRAAFERARATNERVTHRAYLAPLDGWFETTAYATDDGLAVYLRDVTDDERARAEAQRSRAQLEQQAMLLHTARDAMLVRDIDGTVRYWNHAAEQMYGWSTEEAVGQSVFDLVGMGNETRSDALAVLMRDGFFAGEVPQITRDGRTIIVDCRWQVLYDDQGQPESIFAVNSDITEHRREQDARARAQRMESLGTLAGGIAHDLNNVLTPVLMSVQLLEQDEDDATRRELLSTVEVAVKRGADMIRQVLSFARGVEGRRVAVNVDQLVDDVVAFARNVLPSGITVDVDRDASLPGTIGDPTQLLQVLVNLITNAKDALDGAGSLRISATTVEVEEGHSSITHAAAAGSYVTITVDDSGHGMPPDVVEKIFEPFFTTKVPGKGTGLGLATSLAIVRAHGGFMQVSSTPGAGTRIVVGLPAVAAAPVRVAPPISLRTELPRGNGELVLVIDDEETIRNVTSRTLQALGYRTAVASNGHEAIALIEGGHESVDLVITDMMMPLMDGAATSAYLEEHHPDIPVIAASGLNSGGDSSRAVGMGIARFLAKPYTTRDLIMTVRDTLLEHRSTREGTE